jgi:DNA-directed RNA polymerase subunit H
LVPKHEILPKEAASELLKQYGLNSEKLPQVQSEDPVVLEIGAKRGDVLKITRKSHTAGECVYFRIVV